MDCDNGLEVISNDGVLDIIPASEYDPFEAKFCSSLFWLVFHATEDGGLEDVPSQVTSPIQHTGENGFVVHPEIVQFLTKGEVYCTVCSRVFPGKVALAGHWSVIQTLSRNGNYVVDGITDVAVTDSSLEQTNPFNQGAHIALMDALMTAYSSQVVSIQAVVQAVRRFSTFSASRELPFDLEDALLLWINKLSGAVNDKHMKAAQSGPKKLLRGREQERKVGVRVDNQESTHAVIPIIDDLLKGLCDGRSLLGIVLFYEPSVIKMEDILSSYEFSTDDSIRNLDLFRGLCSQYFCTSVLALKVEDILYGSPSLKINIVAMLAEMFSKCERETKPEQNIPRSKTACSENNQAEMNGEDPRSHSAPVSRNRQDILLKIQNFVENVGSSEDLHVGEERRESVVKMKSDEEDREVADQDMVEVDGVVVKLRKKVPRDIQPGGGHEALLSRRMKKSLFNSSNEDVSKEPTQIISGPENGFDADCDDVHDETKPEFSEIPDEEKIPDLSPSMPSGEAENLGLSSTKETPRSFELDFGSLPESNSPIDMLSPISETTEPRSLENSLNISTTSARGIQFPTADDVSPIGHEAVEQDKETGHEILSPTMSQTPRNVGSQNQSSLQGSIPRGSYVINASYTVESAVAAGIPVVERESVKSVIAFHGNTGPGRSSREDMSLRFPGKKTSNDGDLPSSDGIRGDTCESVVVNGQQGDTEDQITRNNNRFSTFRKNIKNDKMENDPSLNCDKTMRKDHRNTRQVHRSKNSSNPDPSITWFVRGNNNDDISQNDYGSRKPESDNHVTQCTVVEPGVKKTSWAMTEENGGVRKTSWAMADDNRKSSQSLKKG